MFFVKKILAFGCTPFLNFHFPGAPRVVIVLLLVVGRRVAASISGLKLM